MQLVTTDQLGKRVVALKDPVTDHRGCQGRYHGSLKPDHGINPLTHTAILFEEFGINEIHATCPCHFAVNHHNFPMQTQIGATNQSSK